MTHVRMLTGVAVLMLALVGANQAAAGDKNGSGVASLTGEALLSSETGTPGTSSVTGTCNPFGNSTFNFTVTGQAFGPYPGTFTESGTFTIGMLGALLTFQASFQITSPNGTVSGTKTLSGPIATGFCGIDAFPAEPDSISISADLAYSNAQITTPNGSRTDSGISHITFQDFQFRGTALNGFSFDEDFTSTATLPCDDDDDGDNGGDCDEDEQ